MTTLARCRRLADEHERQERARQLAARESERLAREYAKAAQEAEEEDAR